MRTVVAYFDLVERDEEEAHRKAWDTRGRKDVTTVGITSARAKGEPDWRSNREVFHQMGQFKDRLAAIKSVADVSVKPGVGAWQGGKEATWVVSYRGNGEAMKLLATTAKTYNQDAVLVMKPGGGDPSVELEFDGPVGARGMAQIEKIMVGHGLGGWTYYKSGGQTVLRSVSVPQWGSDSAAHLRAMSEVSAVLKAAGRTHRVRQASVQASVLERGRDY